MNAITQIEIERPETPRSVVFVPSAKTWGAGLYIQEMTRYRIKQATIALENARALSDRASEIEAAWALHHVAGLCRIDNSLKNLYVADEVVDALADFL